jgi:TonB family protein
VRAIRTWKFIPARPAPAGEIWNHVFRIRFQLEGLNVVLYSPASHLLLNNLSVLTEGDGSLTYRACLPRELDRIPRPRTMVVPQATKAGTVDIEFFIDESGRVRIPTVRQSSDPELSALALAAVRQWRFEPPLREGAPVLVHIDQLFHLQPASASAHPASAP